MLDKHYYKKITLLIASFIAILNTQKVLAQVISDNTLPKPTVVVDISDTSEQKLKIIEGTQQGRNLFHSFREFSLQQGQVAHFDNHPTDVSNIITRITGNSVSNIDGAIKANGSANLFFLNPNGIIFGRNASLDIGGSFIATTASKISFADGKEFSTNSEANEPILSMAVPTGLQFGFQPQTIVNRSQAPPLNFDKTPSGLSVKPTNTIILLGGDILLEGGNINAFAGRIELGSVGSGSFVNLLTNSQGWQLDYSNVQIFQDIHLQQGREAITIINSAGEPSIINASGDRGTINLQASGIFLADSSRINNLSLSDTQSPGKSAINATELVHLVNEARINVAHSELGLTSGVGTIVIKTKKLIIESGAAIEAGNFGNTQQGGQVIINAAESVEVIGVSSMLPSIITTTAFVEPPDQGLGNSGTIEINTKRLTVADGGLIISAAVNSGQSGTITINASESLLVKGVGVLPDGDSHSTINTNSQLSLSLLEEGSGGNISINSPQLRVENNALISSDSSSSLARAGTIQVQAQVVTLNNEGKITTTSDSGAGGNINILAKDYLTLRDHSTISAEAGSSGTGGNINITTPFIFAVPRENSDIQANALGGTGGNINIQATAIFGIQQRPAPTPLSDITATGRNEALAGQINITRPEIDPESALLNQDTEVLDTQGLIVQTCGTGGKFASGEFIITGRGGLPPDPVENVSMPVALPDLGVRQTLSSTPTDSPKTKKTRQPTTIVEAQGWRVNAAGELELIATGTATPRNLPQPCLPEDYQLSYN